MGNIRLVYADAVNMSGKNFQTVRENTEVFTKASKDKYFEVNPGNTKYMIMSRQQNVVQHQNITIRNLQIEKVEKFKYLGVTVTNTNHIHEDIKRRINMGNACYYSLE